jgi:hypothetical protein
MALLDLEICWGFLVAQQRWPTRILQVVHEFGDPTWLACHDADPLRNE